MQLLFDITRNKTTVLSKYVSLTVTFLLDRSGSHMFKETVITILKEGPTTVKWYWDYVEIGKVCFTSIYLI